MAGMSVEKSYSNDWNHVSRKAGMNCWIGKLLDGIVTTVQTMPWNYRPWECGSGKKGSCNNGWIQFEICEDNKNDADYFGKISLNLPMRRSHPLAHYAEQAFCIVTIPHSLLPIFLYKD